MTLCYTAEMPQIQALMTFAVFHISDVTDPISFWSPIIAGAHFEYF